ncbi:type I secretion target [Pseudomonas paralactis]|uniref:Type I secretion target n=1 Tax=Pseudomonas paralactis TaxID=1615673 RepID=A0A0R3AF74_9PSED|nr:calcium-binding protein [Pseudomonas paralactis]KRP70844.1 type I secretion target [Pseudomonas paralactis]
MLLPLTHSAVPHYSTASTEPQRSKPSPYAPPSDLQRGVPNIRTHLLLEKGDVTFSREITWSTRNPEKPQISSSRLVVETSNGADEVHVRSWPGDKLQFIINGRPYVLEAKAPQGPDQSLLIKTNGGDDRVIIDDDVKHRLEVQGGAGNDFIQAGGGMSGLFGGSGHDILLLGSNSGYAEGNDGDDLIIGGSGNAFMFGNGGNDRLDAGVGNAHKQNLLDGGDGDDKLYAGSGTNHLIGGNGNDLLTGHDRTSFYTGEGNDRIANHQPTDSIHTRVNDQWTLTQGSALNEARPGKAGEQPS